MTTSAPRLLGVLAVSTLLLTTTSHAGFTWTSANGYSGTHAVGAGQGLHYGVWPGNAQPATNASHILQGVRVELEAYDASNNPLTLNPSDFNVATSSGGGQVYTLTRDIEGYVCITYKWLYPWVTNQGTSSPWDPNVIGHPTSAGISIESKMTHNSNPDDFTFTKGQFYNGNQIDPTTGTWTDLYTPTTGSSTHVDGTGFDGTGTGLYVHVDPNSGGGNTRWDASSNLNPFDFRYNEDRYYFLPTGNYTSNGNNALRSGTSFAFTHNGALLNLDTVPEPTRPTLLLLALTSLILRRKR